MKKSFKRKYLFECVSERRRKKIVEVEEQRRKEIGMMKEDGRRKFDASRFPPHFKQSRQSTFHLFKNCPQITNAYAYTFNRINNRRRR